MTEKIDRNYVFVDEEIDVIHVYDSHGETAPREFTVDSYRWIARSRAERYAEDLALQLECGWGTNYP